MIKAGIIGATGYTGAELIRLLTQHPDVELAALTTQSHGGALVSNVFPHFGKQVELICQESDIAEVADLCDVVFVALPHAVASRLVTEKILNATKVVDLGADFRLKKVETYEKWYLTKHENPTLISKATYGLPEWNEAEIVGASLIANPGCYATAAILALSPLVKFRAVQESSIIVDAKSGVSGAGRAANLGTHFNECNETIKAYGLTTHRHTPEIEQQLSLQGSDITITFTPHLVPMNRGILVTAYGTLNEGMTAAKLSEIFQQCYGNKPFVRLCSPMNGSGGGLPETRWVKGSNYCDIGFAIDERTNRVIVVSALDNLVKGASGQAVQNMNLMFGFPQERGLMQLPMFPG